MAAIQGYKLYYKEEGQQESGPILLRARDSSYTVGGLGEQDLTLFLMTLPVQGGRASFTAIRANTEQEGWSVKASCGPREVAQMWPNLFMGSLGLEEAVSGPYLLPTLEYCWCWKGRGSRMLTWLCLS